MAKLRYVPPRRKRQMNNYKFAMGMGVNYYDMDTGYVYMIQEYKEKMDDPNIPLKDKPKKIRVMNSQMTILLDEVAPEILEEQMKDPEPDPKYAPETEEEIRKELRMH